MSFESLDFAYRSGVDKKITYALNWTQILLILCKRLNEVNLINVLTHQTQADFGAKSVFYVFCI